MRLTYTVSVGSTSLGVGAAGGGSFIARTASDSSSKSSAAFLLKRMLIFDELRGTSGVTELDSAPLRRNSLSVSESLLSKRDRAAVNDEFCPDGDGHEDSTDAPSLSRLLFVTSNG